MAAVETKVDIKSEKDSRIPRGIDVSEVQLGVQATLDKQASGLGLEVKVKNELKENEREKPIKKVEFSVNLIANPVLDPEVNCLEYCVMAQTFALSEYQYNKKGFPENQPKDYLESIAALEKVLDQNPKITRLVFQHMDGIYTEADRNPPYRINKLLGKNWEQPLLDCLKRLHDKGRKIRLVLENMCPRHGLTIDDFNLESGPNDMSNFFQRAREAGVEELHMGNTVLGQALPSRLEGPRLKSRDGFWESCGPFASVCCVVFLPISLCCLITDNNPLICATDPREGFNERNLKIYRELDQAQLERDAEQWGSFSVLIFSTDQKNSYLKDMAKLYNSKAEVPITKMIRGLQHSSRQLRVLHLGNLGLEYVKKSEKPALLEFLLTGLELLEELDLTESGMERAPGDNFWPTYSDPWTTEECNKIAGMFPRSNIRRFKGLEIPTKAGNKENKDTIDLFNVLQGLAKGMKNLKQWDISQAHVTRLSEEQLLQFAGAIANSGLEKVKLVRFFDNDIAKWIKMAEVLAKDSRHLTEVEDLSNVMLHVSQENPLREKYEAVCSDLAQRLKENQNRGPELKIKLDNGNAQSSKEPMVLQFKAGQSSQPGQSGQLGQAGQNGNPNSNANGSARNGSANANSEANLQTATRSQPDF